MAKEMDPYQTVQTLISQYYAAPESFSAEQVMQIKAAADELGVEFKIPEDFGRMAKNFLFNAADTATFGFLPDSIFGNQIKPDALTTSDKMAGGLGDVAGFFTSPWAVGGMAEKAALKGIEGLAAKAGTAAAKGATKTTGMTGLMGALERMGMGPKAAQGVGNLMTKGLAKATGLKGATTGFAAKGAKALQEYVSPQLIGSAVKYGTASAASELGNDLGDGNFGQIINRALGGAFLGGAAHVVGGAAQGVIPKVVNQLTGLAAKTGTQQAIRIMTAAIWGNMTAPEREQYPQEFVQQFLINSLMAYK